MCYESSMNVRELRQINLANPFRPYTIRTSDGQTVHVPHPDYMLIAPSGDTLVVYDQDGLMHIIDTDQISKLEMRQKGRSSK